MQSKKRSRVISAAVAGCAAGIVGALPQPRALADDIDTLWIGRGSNSSWTNAANWDQVIVPDGENDVARFGPTSAGPIVDLSNASIALSTLDFSDPLFAAIIAANGAGTINLGGAATVYANGNNFDLPEKVYASFGTTDLNNPRPGNNLSIGIVGSLGLNKTGDSHLQIDAPQFYTGTTTIAGGKIITTIGDAAFGDASNPIFLNNGSIQISNNFWNSNRTIYAGGGVGSETSNASIHWVNGSVSLAGAQFFGDLAGVGSLQLNGFYTTSIGSLSAGSAVFHNNNSFSGTLNITGGTVSLRDDGAFANLGTHQVGQFVAQHAIINSGTLVLDNSNSLLSVDRIKDDAPINMRGSALTLIGGSGSYNENIGSLQMDGGVSFITVMPGSGGASVRFSSLDRRDVLGNTGTIFLGAGLVFRGQNLGGTFGPNTANIFIGTGSTGVGLIQNGLLPFAYGNASYTSSSTPESPDNVLVTYDALTGVKPITSYTPNFVGTGTQTNVRIDTSLNTGTTLVNANALVIAAPANYVYGAGTATTPLTISGAGTIHLESGVLLSANAGYNGSTNNINSLPGNIIAVNLDFGAVPATIMTPSALTISGVISGTGGLTKLGARTAAFTGGNTYTGPTYLTGFTRFSGSVWSDAFTPSPFGLATTPITIYGGNASPVNPTTNSLNGTGFGQLISDSTGPSTTNFHRKLELRGDRVLLRNFANGTLLFNSDSEIKLLDPATQLVFLTSKSTAHIVVDAQIKGPVIGKFNADTDLIGGMVIIGSADTGDSLAPTWVDLRNENIFNGGLILAGGTIGIGHDRALGGQTITLRDDADLPFSIWQPSAVKVSGNTLMTALDGPRAIDNQFVIYGNTLGIGGSNTITLSGTLEGRGSDYVANITSTVPTIISGTLSGGGLAKTGSGTLVLSGNNIFTGVLSVGVGTTQGGVVVVKNSNAFGSTVGPTGVDFGTTSGGTAGQQNQLILDGSSGNLNIGAEPLYLKGFGISNTGALRNLSGNNTWGGVVRPTPTYRDVGTATVSLANSIAAGIGVDTGSTLTLSAGLLMDDDPGAKNNLGTTVFLANFMGIRKVGAGTLILGSSLVSSGSSTWNAALNATGTFDIQGGTVRIKSNSGVGSIASGRSVAKIGTLAISGTGKLDLTDNALILNYTGGSPATALRAMIRNGYGAGSWNGGSGVISSTATPSIYAAGKITLGYVDTATSPMSSIFGHPLDGTAIVIRSAYAGDSNLDGMVDVQDLTEIATNWQQSSRFWETGDFNYDGLCNVNDLLLMAMNWQIGVSNPLPGPDLSSMLVSLDLPGIEVPEPASGAICVGMAGCLLLRRRRHGV